jgi:hypothetical protein
VVTVICKSFSVEDGGCAGLAGLQRVSDGDAGPKQLDAAASKHQERHPLLCRTQEDDPPQRSQRPPRPPQPTGCQKRAPSGIPGAVPPTAVRCHDRLAKKMSKSHTISHQRKSPQAWCRQDHVGTRIVEAYAGIIPDGNDPYSYRFRVI